MHRAAVGIFRSQVWPQRFYTNGSPPSGRREQERSRSFPQVLVGQHKGLFLMAAAVAELRTISSFPRLLTPSTGRCDKWFQRSIIGDDRHDQDVGSRCDLDERIPKLQLLIILSLFIVIHERVALPMRRAAHPARAVIIVETCKKTIKLGCFVPPNNHQTIQFSCRTIGVNFVDQCSSARVESYPCHSMAPAALREQLAMLHSFGGIPTAGERLRQPLHFGARASLGLRDRTT